MINHLVDLNFIQLKSLLQSAPETLNALIYVESFMQAMTEEMNHERQILSEKISESNYSDRDLRLHVRQQLSQWDLDYGQISNALSDYYSQPNTNQDFFYPLTSFKSREIIQKCNYLNEQSEDFLSNCCHDFFSLELSTTNDEHFDFSDFRQAARDPNQLPWLGGRTGIPEALGLSTEGIWSYWGTEKPAIFNHLLVAASTLFSERPESTVPDQNRSMYWAYPLPTGPEYPHSSLITNVEGQPSLLVYNANEYSYGGVGVKKTDDVTSSRFPPRDCSSFIADFYHLPYRTATRDHIKLSKYHHGFGECHSKRLSDTLITELGHKRCPGDLLTVSSMPHQLFKDPEHLGDKRHISIFLDHVQSQDYALLFSCARVINNNPKDCNGIHGYGVRINGLFSPQEAIDEANCQYQVFQRKR
ncbi:MAG: hypothetical protein CMF42_03140 [Legionellales bacterium]|nr:hypothetical protein [Legionellales bacterium]OUX67765.1 MAG: hypothetical protein CBD38_02005 [bacterium TMED178]